MVYPRRNRCTRVPSLLEEGTTTIKTIYSTLFTLSLPHFPTRLCSTTHPPLIPSLPPRPQTNVRSQPLTAVLVVFISPHSKCVRLRLQLPSSAAQRSRMWRLDNMHDCNTRSEFSLWRSYRRHAGTMSGTTEHEDGTAQLVLPQVAPLTQPRNFPVRLALMADSLQCWCSRRVQLEAVCRATLRASPHHGE